MKIFEVDSVDDLKDGTVAAEVDGKGNPIDHSVQKPSEPQVALAPQETKEEKNARIARENMEMLAKEEQKFEDENLKNYLEEKNLLVKKIDEKESENKVKEIIENNKGAPFGALMGKAMGAFNGQVDGKLISQILKKLI